MSLSINSVVPYFILYVTTKNYPLRTTGSIYLCISRHFSHPPPMYVGNKQNPNKTIMPYPPKKAPPPKKKTIIFIHPDLGIGGAERLVIDAALGLKSLGHTVVIFTSHCDPNHCFDEARNGMPIKNPLFLSFAAPAPIHHKPPQEQSFPHPRPPSPPSSPPPHPNEEKEKKIPLAKNASNPAI